jgi:type II secretory pathway pseudopilin PulG
MRKGMFAISSLAENNREAGYGLLEIVTVVAVAAVITAASVIVFGKAKACYDISQKADNFAWRIERARSAALRNNKTLTLGFSSEHTTFGLTCSDCSQAKLELPEYSIPSDISLSSYPTITIRGNGTMNSTSPTITISDGDGRQVTITLNNSGRVVVGSVEDEG